MGAAAGGRAWPGSGRRPGPTERLAALVPGVHEPTDRGDQLGHAGEVPTPQGLAGSDRKEDLDQVQPRRRGRGEVQPDPGMAGQPGPDRGVLVGGVVVHHHMQLPTRVCPGDQLEERQELLVAVPRVALVGDPPGGHLQRGKQRRGAVAGVVMGVPLGRPGASGRTGWVRSSAWIWDFSSRHSTTALSGGSRYSPTTSQTLASSSGSVENLNVAVCQGLRPCSRQTRATVLWLQPSSPASSRLDQ
jgi:hypothetical protein